MEDFIKQAQNIITSFCGKEQLKELKSFLDECKEAGFTQKDLEPVQQQLLMYFAAARFGLLPKNE